MSKASIWWRDINILGKEYTNDPDWFKQLVKLQLGRGDKIRFWIDSWCGPRPFCSLYPELFEATAEKEAKVQHYGLSVDGLWVWDWRWGESATGVAAAQLEELKVILHDIKIQTNAEDSWTWIADHTKRFSVKSCYSWLTEACPDMIQQRDEEKIMACSKVWRCDVPTKAAVMAWRLILNRLPTRDALIRRGVVNSNYDSCCVLCFREDESAKHLFCCCKKTQEVWSSVASWLQVSDVKSQEPLQHFNLFGNLMKGRKLKGTKHMVWIATVWSIWHARNKVIFEGSVFNVKNVVNHIKLVSWGWFIFRKGRKTKMNFGDWLNSPMGCMLSV